MFECIFLKIKIKNTILFSINRKNIVYYYRIKNKNELEHFHLCYYKSETINVLKILLYSLFK